MSKDLPLRVVGASLNLCGILHSISTNLFHTPPQAALLRLNWFGPARGFKNVVLVSGRPPEAGPAEASGRVRVGLDLV